MVHCITTSKGHLSHESPVQQSRDALMARSYSHAVRLQNETSVLCGSMRLAISYTCVACMLALNFAPRVLYEHMANRQTQT